MGSSKNAEDIISSNRELHLFLTEIIFIFAHFSQMENFNPIVETHYL